MIINTNMVAIETVNLLEENSKSKIKASKQLSSGEKISSAGDGVSEYAISEKMRTQILSLDECIENVRNGRSMINVATGGVDNQVEIMKRIREVTLKSSNGIYTSSDRQILQSEVNQLLDEVEELAQTTNFNGRPLLNRDTMTSHVAWFDPDVPYQPIPSTTPVIPEAAASPDGKYTVPQVGTISNLELKFDDLIASLTNIPKDLDELGFSLNCGGCNQFVTVKFNAKTDISTVYGGNPNANTDKAICYVIGVNSVTDTKSLGEAIFNGVYNAGGTGSGGIPSTNDQWTQIALRHQIRINYSKDTGALTLSKDGPTMTFLNGIKGAMVVKDGFQPYQDLALQTGTKSSSYTNLRLYDTSLKTLFPSANADWDITPKETDFPNPWPEEYEWNHKENRAMTEVEKKQKWTEEAWIYPARFVYLEKEQCISTQEKAIKFIDDIDQAIKYLINANTKMGAQANVLDYTEENLITASENVQSSESVIRDADMGKAIVGHTKSNILVQTSQMVLAQANQNAQRVLSLLQ